jgi:hypothetical protein
MTENALSPQSRGLIFTPYYHSNIRGSKAGLLTDLTVEDLPPGMPSFGLPSRRDVLRASAITAGGILVVGLRPTRAHAAFDLLAAIFTAGVMWFVKRVLDEIFPPNPTPADLGLRRNPNPTPSHSRFSNSFAEPWEITNRQLWRRPRRHDDYGFGLGLEKATLLQDMNGVELQHLERAEEHFGSPLVAADVRVPYKELSHRNVFKRIKEGYHRSDFPELTEEDIQFVRPYRDTERREHLGVGVKWGGKARLLLD